MLCKACSFLMSKHLLYWKYQYNKYMFNLFDNESFIPVCGGLGMSPSVLFFPGAYNAVKTALNKW